MDAKNLTETTQTQYCGTPCNYLKYLQAKKVSLFQDWDQPDAPGGRGEEEEWDEETKQESGEKLQAKQFIKYQEPKVRRDSIMTCEISHCSSRFRRSRSQSGSPPYGRQPVSLPPIERPKTMGSQNSLRRSRTPGRADIEQKMKNGRNTEVHFSVSGKGLKQPDDRKNGMSSRISLNGPVHWGELHAFWSSFRLTY